MGKKRNLLQLMGILLILGSLGLLLASRIQADQAKTAATALAERVEALLPERTQGITDAYSNPDMPVLQIDGQDLVCLMDVPAFGVTLPVYSTWDTEVLQNMPCRFWGSTYDSSLVLGGSDQTGQFDFCSKLDIGYMVIVTDMTGAEFHYTVSWIERAKTAEAERLISREHDLTLFVRNAYSMEYIIVRCTAA